MRQFSHTATARLCDSSIATVPLRWLDNSTATVPQFSHTAAATGDNEKDARCHGDRCNNSDQWRGHTSYNNSHHNTGINWRAATPPSASLQATMGTPRVAGANECHQPTHKHTNTTTPPWELSQQQLRNNSVGCYGGCIAMRCNRVCQDAAPQQRLCAMKTAAHFFMAHCSVAQRSSRSRQPPHNKIGTAKLAQQKSKRRPSG